MLLEVISVRDQLFVYVPCYSGFAFIGALFIWNPLLRLGIYIPLYYWNKRITIRLQGNMKFLQTLSIRVYFEAYTINSP